MKIFLSIATLFALSMSLKAMQSPTSRQALEYLSFIDMGTTNQAHHINNLQMLKMPASSLWYSRVFGSGDFSAQDIEQTINYFAGSPFSWWIAKSDLMGQGLLKQAGLTENSSEWLMDADFVLSERSEKKDNLRHEIFNSQSNNNFIDLWVKTSAQGFGIAESEVHKFANYIIAHAGINYYFCITFLLEAGGQETPISTSLSIRHPETLTLSIHQVSTIEAYRKLGAATQSTSVQLLQAYDQGYEKALLFSSEMAHNLFERLSFKNSEEFVIFTYEAPLVSKSGGCDIL